MWVLRDELRMGEMSIAKVSELESWKAGSQDMISQMPGRQDVNI
jgi:hypothetical protein